MISQNIKKQIIDQTNIVEVVGEVVKLTKKEVVILVFALFIMIIIHR